GFSSPTAWIGILCTGRQRHADREADREDDPERDPFPSKPSTTIHGGPPDLMPVDRSHRTPTRARSGPDSYEHFAAFRPLFARSPARHVGQPVGTGSAQIRWS